jgi:hypothetical protein
VAALLTPLVPCRPWACLEAGKAAALPDTGSNFGNGKSVVVLGARVTMAPGLRVRIR